MYPLACTISTSTSRLLMQCLVFLTLIAVSKAQQQDFQICCLKAARSQIELTQLTPWDMCPYGANITDNVDNLYPSVNATMSWCKQNCPGYQSSSVAEWLHPVVQWIVPYLTLLILCPIGGLRKEKKMPSEFGEDRKPRKDGEKQRKQLNTLENWADFIKQQLGQLMMAVTEYAFLIGDPASSLWGAYSNLWLNAKLTGKLENANDFDKEMIGVVIVAGQQDLDDFDEIKGEPIVNSLLRQIHYRRSSSISMIPSYSDEPHKAGGNTFTTEKSTPSLNVLTQDLRDALAIVLDAQVAFIKSVFIPVILTIAVTASVFYDAYQNLGDNDTAHSIAFGIFYSWLIPLVVGSAAFSGAMNAELLEHTIGSVLENIPKRTVPLRTRYVNAARWIGLLHDAQVLQRTEFGRQGDRGWSFFGFYMFGQLISWGAVGFACGCAAAVSYTTPTVGLGCRSFNFLLYGIMSLLVAFVMVVRQWAETYHERGSHIELFMRYTYRSVAFLNFCVLFIGTILHLVGVYAQCMCHVLGVKGDFLLQLGWNTAQDVTNAKIYWLPVGYVAFSGAWLLSTFAILVKMKISRDVNVLRKL